MVLLWLPKISEIIMNGSFVDDMVTGGDNIEKVAKLIKSVYDELATGCFQFNILSNDLRA